MSKPIIKKQSEIPQEEVRSAESEKPWLGKTVTSFTSELELEDPKADYVAVGYPHLRRTSQEDQVVYYVPDVMGNYQLEIVGWEALLQCAICSFKENKVAGASAKT